MGIYSPAHFLSLSEWLAPWRLTAAAGLVLCFLYALRKGALVCRSVPGPLFLALLPDSDVPSPLEWGDEPGEEQGLGRGTDCTVITSKTQEYHHTGLMKMPMICGVSDPSEKPVTRNKPQGGKQTVWLPLKSPLKQNGQFFSSSFFFFLIEYCSIYYKGFICAHHYYYFLINLPS